jgi:hypothetical protein
LVLSSPLILRGHPERSAAGAQSKDLLSPFAGSDF